MRGSLIELPLPEVKENDNEHNEHDELKSGEDSPTKECASNRRRKSGRPCGEKNAQANKNKSKFSQNRSNHDEYVSSLNLRRFISIADGASFYNAPFNLEPIEFNLRNSLIKKCSDSYRRHQSFRNKSHHHHHEKWCPTLFFNYLSYLTSFKLLANYLLLMLNVSFLFVIVGICVPLIYLSELVVLKGKGDITRMESIYFLSLIGFMMGIGRIISLIAYRVNESNAKNRIFSYTLTLFLSGLTLICSTYLCDTLFSFTVFSIFFGVVLGKTCF